MKNMDWYHSLNSPFLSPPEWVFAPVWAILYISLGISLFVFLKNCYKHGFTNGRKIAIAFFSTQLVLNFSWTSVFFAMQNIFWALVILFLIWLLTLISMIMFFFYSTKAALILIPYFIWICFAFYLNFGYFVLN